MLFLNFLLDCCVILNLLLSDFLFHELRIFECPSIFMYFFAIVFCVSCPISTAAISFSVPVSRCIASTDLKMHMEDSCIPVNQHLSHPVPAHFQIYLVRELQDIVLGTPEPSTCSKSKSTRNRNKCIDVSKKFLRIKTKRKSFECYFLLLL